MSNFAVARQNMVDSQVRPSDVTDLRIIEAMLQVPREAFVPESLRTLAYLDLNLDVGKAGETGCFLIRPAVLAKMLQAAEISETDRVLVVGCATGYCAAVVSRLAGQVEATTGIVPAANSGSVRDDAANARFDVIVLHGATEIVPNHLYRRLSDGGRLVGVFGITYPQRAMIVTHSHADFGTRALFDATVPVLPGFERPPAFVFQQ